MSNTNQQSSARKTVVKSDFKNTNKNLSEMTIQNAEKNSNTTPVKFSPSPNVNLNQNSIETEKDDTNDVIEVIKETSNNNNDVVKTEKIRNAYIIAPVKEEENSYLCYGEDSQIMKLKTNPSQQVYTTNFHMLVNVKYDTTKDPSALKTIRAGNILKGKTFPINIEDLDKKVKVLKIKIEGTGKNAPDISDKELKQAKEQSLIQKLTVKVNWISPYIFNDHQTAKVLTEKGLPLLISLDPSHHNTLKKDDVFTFVNITKTDNWFSTNAYFKDVNMKFKTTLETSVIHVPIPSQAFLQLGKMVARVIGIDQKMFIFDQCQKCYKSKSNETCGQEACPEYGIKTPKNPTFVTHMVIDKEDNPEDVAETVKIWNNQLLDFPFNKLVPTDDLETAIVLQDLEKHYVGNMITYKGKNANAQMNEKFKTITTVSLKPSNMEID